MANVKLGSQAGWKFNYAENLDSDRQLNPGDSGKLFFADKSSAVLVNLPQLSDVEAGWSCKIIVDVDGGQDISVVGYGQPAAGGSDGDANKVCIATYTRDGNASTYDADADGFTIEAAGVIGDSVTITTNGSLWFAEGFSSAAAGMTAIAS